MNIRHSKKYYLIYYVAFFLICVSFWIKKNFGQTNINEIISNLYLVHNLGTAPELKINRYFIYNPILLTVLVIIFEKILNFSIHNGIKQLIKSFIEHKIWIYLKKLIQKIYFFNVPFLILIIALIYFFNSTNIIDSFKKYNTLGDNDFYESFVSQADLIHKGKSKKNIIHIYIEGIENTFADQNFFEKNNLYFLNQLDNRYGHIYSFKNFKQYEGANFTIAGLVSSQCGIPITPRIKSLTNNFSSFNNNNKKFIKSKCLGDYLAENGYYNVFMGGASLDFTNKGKFFKDHRFTEVYGKEEWEKMNLSQSDFHRKGWGLHDDSLFRQAKEKTLELYKTKQPFNLTILTVDTHMPIGHLSNTCASYGFDILKYTHIVECTARLVSEYVNFLKENSILDNTLLVITGDHIAMDGLSIINKLKLNPHRTVFNLFISPTKLKKNRDDFSHFSILPSILSALDFEFNNNRLGLGMSGFGKLNDEDIETLLDFKSTDEINPKLIAPSTIYNNYL